MQKKYYIGPAGWSYKDWEGIVYPFSKDKNFHQLTYISNFFNTIEINSSFYRPPTAQTAKKWIERVRANPHFSFTYKLWQEFTHTRETFPADDKIKMVKSGLDPLLEDNKLGALLIQFPWSFKITKENRDWLDKVIDLFYCYHPVLEVRHDSWNQPEIFSYLRNKKIGFANIDQPIIGKSMGLSAIRTSDVSYLRLHGRNYKNWFHENATAASRYNYLYNSDELSDLIETANALIENSPKTYIIFNNHFRGQAVANALQMKFLLEKQNIAIPPLLVEHFTDLKNIAKMNEQQGQIPLFSSINKNGR